MTSAAPAAPPDGSAELTIAGLALSRDRLMGIGQAITMPLFFASNALYPVSLRPGWLRALSRATR